MNEAKTLKQLGWKIYKKRQNQIIYQKYSSENLLIIRKSEKYIELKNIYSLTFEEFEAIKLAYKEFTYGEFVKKEIKKNRKEIEEMKKDGKKL
jgi:hypothetical protein|nr:MAG TPA: hypothetical protein [Caudoviricetes sp.]